MYPALAKCWITSDAMTRELVNAICRAFPGAEVSDPWGGGHDAWKVGGKMFACIGAVMPGILGQNRQH